MTSSAFSRLRRATRSAVATLALAGLAACDGDSPLTPLPAQGPPTTLEFSMGGFGGDSYAFELKGETVEFVRTPWEGMQNEAPDTLRAKPTAQQWEAFWAEARAAGVGRWRGEHVARDVIDGTGWRLEIVAGGRRIEAVGSNLYPDRKGEWHPGMTPDFRRFTDAVYMLVGLVVN